jgi:2-polyprenyl-3-methyl-5-hydroxy-6-metoxy-1,4-benzoquinol methylase
MPHWTEELFKENPELFIGIFEQRLDRASAEMDRLLGYLEEQGLQTGRILDLNCGIGRHSMELGRRGIKVLGTDISPRYIQVAQDMAREANMTDSVRFQVADMRQIASKLAGEEPFDGIICLWTSYGFYDDDTNEDVLRQCLKLVKPGGFFALDIVNRDWLIRNFNERSFTNVGDYIILEERKFDPLNSRNYSTWTFLKRGDEGSYILEKKVDIDHRIWSPHELAYLYSKTGWEFRKFYPGLAIGFTPRGLSSPASQDKVLDNAMILAIACRPEERAD